MRMILFCFLMLSCVDQAYATSVAVIDSNGSITATVDFSGFDWKPGLGLTAIAQTSPPMQVGGSVINGVYTPPPAPPAPPPTSVAVAFQSNSALNGTYAFDAVTQSKILAVSLYIQVNGKFPAGQTSFPWPDASGTMHIFTSTAQFQALATALADYATALAIGQTPTAPVTMP